MFFIGRNLDYAVALEAQLKLKEISYIHAEAYAAGELKHGPLALITDGVPVVALTRSRTWRRRRSPTSRRPGRGGRSSWGWEGERRRPATATGFSTCPAPPPPHPTLAVIPMQLLAYYAATARGTDVDKPRNLAKSVTVE